MSDQNISVKFSAQGGDLSNFMNKVKKESKEMSDEAVEGGKKQIEVTEKKKKALEGELEVTKRKNQAEKEAIGIQKEKKRLAEEESRGAEREKQRTGGGSSLPSSPEQEKRVKSAFEQRRARLFSEKSLSDQGFGTPMSEEEYQKKKAKIDEDEVRVLAETKNKLKEERQERTETKEDRKRKDREEAQERKKKAQEEKDDRRRATDEEKEEKKRKKEEEKDQRRKEKDGRDSQGNGVAAVMFGLDALNKFVGAANTLAGTQNGFDMIAPMSGLKGQLIGSVLGGIAGSLIPGLGTMAGIGAGGALGGAVGSLTGNVDQREALTGQDYIKARNRYSALTGISSNADAFRENMQGSGINLTDFLTQQAAYAKKLGTSNGSDVATRDALFAQKGFGLDEGTIGGIIDFQRSAKEGNKDLATLLGGVIEKGQNNFFKNGDHTFLGEFLNKFTNIQKELLKNSSTVATGTTMDIMEKFNSLGGMWDMKDPRSMNNIMGVQHGLSNPGSDNLKALSFAVLRAQNPNAGIFDLLEARQGGLSSKGYLKGMLSKLDQFGGSDQNKMLQLSNMFPELSLSAVRRMYENRDSLKGNMSMDELKAKYPVDFKKASEENTAPIERIAAEIVNKVLSGNLSEGMAKAFSDAVHNEMKGAVIELAEGNKLKLKSFDTVKTENVTRKAVEATASNQITQDIKRTNDNSKTGAFFK